MKTVRPSMAGKADPYMLRLTMKAFLEQQLMQKQTKALKQYPVLMIVFKFGF